MSRLAVTACLTAIAVIGATAVPAVADTVTFRDQRRDAPARYDLTLVKVINGDDRFEVNARVRDLRDERTQVFGFGVTPAAGDATYCLLTVRRASGVTTARLTRYTSDSVEGIGCKTARRWKPAMDTIRVSIGGCPDFRGTSVAAR
jgi:hypothetical protein